MGYIYGATKHVKEGYVTTQTSDAALHTAEYVLSRLTSWFGNRPDHFSAFIDGKVKAEGWLPAEAYFALTGPVSRSSITVSSVAGKSQGSATFAPDMELDIEKESHQLAVIPVLTSDDQPLSAQVDTVLAESLTWLTGQGSAKTILYLIAFPGSTDDDDWKAAVAKIEQKCGAKPIGEMQFVVPRPPRTMLRAAAAVFVAGDRLPTAANTA